MLYNRVLITGANGLLGQALVDVMSRHPEYDVLATGRDAVPLFRGGSCGYAPLDITDTDQVARIFQDFTPDVVVNCAAMTQVDACHADRETCWRVNADAVGQLSKHCFASGSRLIQVSTDFVFDGMEGPYAESARMRPVNFYGKSKQAGENEARGAGIDKWAIARTVLVFGTAENLSRSNIVLWVIKELSEGRQIRVVTDQWRTPTYAPDLADGIERIVRYNKSGIYHLSGREFLTVFDFAKIIAETFDLDASLIQPVDSSTFRQPAKRPRRTGFITLKAETELGYKPRPVREALCHLGNRLGLPVTSD